MVEEDRNRYVWEVVQRLKGPLVGTAEQKRGYLGPHPQTFLSQRVLSVRMSAIDNSSREERAERETAYNLTFQAAAGLFRMPSIFHDILVFGHGEEKTCRYRIAIGMKK